MQISEHQRVQAHCSRAKCLGALATLTLAEWEETVADFNGLCAYCLERPFEVLEHFVSVAIAGTTVTNCVPACFNCNHRKRDRTGDSLMEVFGESVINRILQYLSSRVHKETPSLVQSKKRPRTYKRRDYSLEPQVQKPIVSSAGITCSCIEIKDSYTMQELFELLPIPIAELARCINMHAGTLARIQKGEATRNSTINKILLVMSEIYGRNLTIKNVTGINSMVNRRLESKEAKKSSLEEVA